MKNCYSPENKRQRGIPVFVLIISVSLISLAGCVSTFAPSEVGVLLVSVSSEHTATRGQHYLDYRIYIDGGEYKIDVESWNERVLETSIPPGKHVVTGLHFVFQDDPANRGRLQKLNIPFEIERGAVTFLSHELRIELSNADNRAGYIQRGRFAPLTAEVLHEEYEKLNSDERFEGFRLPDIRLIDIGGSKVNTAGMLGNRGLINLFPEEVPDRNERMRFLYSFSDSADRRVQLLEPLSRQEVWKPVMFRGKNGGPLLPEGGIRALSFRQAVDMCRFTFDMDSKGLRDGLVYTLSLSSSPDSEKPLVELVFFSNSGPDGGAAIAFDYSYPGMERARRKLKLKRLENGDLYFDMILVGLAAETLHTRLEMSTQDVPEYIIESIRKRHPGGEIGYIEGDFSSTVVQETRFTIELAPYPSPRWKRMDFATITLILPEGWKGFSKVEEIARILEEGLEMQYAATGRSEYEREYFILSRWNEPEIIAFAAGNKVVFDAEDRFCRNTFPWLVAFHETGHTVSLSHSGFREVYLRNVAVPSKTATLRDEWWESWASFFSIYALREMEARKTEPYSTYATVFSEMADRELAGGEIEYAEYASSAEISDITRLTYLPLLSEVSANMGMEDFIRGFFSGLTSLEKSDHVIGMKEMNDDERNILLHSASAAIISTMNGMPADRLFHKRKLAIDPGLYTSMRTFLETGTQR